MQQEQFTILENQPLTASVFRMVLAGNAGEIRKPGQFVEARLLSPPAHFRLRLAG